jgi:spore coat protein U-like protein
MRRRITTLAAAAMFLLLSARIANAASTSAQIQVSVQVIANCRIVVSDLAFGAYDPLVQHSTQPLDGTANVQVLCTKNLRANVLMDDSGNASRDMHSGSDLLSYAIFSDGARSKTWGTGANAIQITGTGNSPQELTVFGRIPGGQVVPAGWYTDAVTATVDF